MGGEGDERGVGAVGVVTGGPGSHFILASRHCTGEAQSSNGTWSNPTVVSNQCSLDGAEPQRLMLLSLDPMSKV